MKLTTFIYVLGLASMLLAPCDCTDIAVSPHRRTSPCGFVKISNNASVDADCHETGTRLPPPVVTEGQTSTTSDGPYATELWIEIKRAATPVNDDHSGGIKPVAGLPAWMIVAAIFIPALIGAGLAVVGFFVCKHRALHHVDTPEIEKRTHGRWWSG